MLLVGRTLLGGEGERIVNSAEIRLGGRWLAVSGLVVMVGVGACRFDNPAFRRDGQGLREQNKQDPQSESSGTVPEDEGATGQPGAGPGSNAGLPTLTNSSKQGNNTTSPTGTQTPSAPIASSVYCKRGSVYCYPSTEPIGQPGQVHDGSGRGNHLILKGGIPGSGITGGIPGLPNIDEAFKRALYVTPQGSATPKDSFSYAGEDVGFDLWFRHDHPETENWALFEIDGVLAVQRGPDGNFECVAKGANGTLARATLPAPEKKAFIHIGCSLRQGTVNLQINGGGVAFSSAKAIIGAVDAKMHIGKSGSLLSAPDYLGRIAMLRVWTDLPAMDKATSQENREGCAMTGSC